MKRPICPLCRVELQHEYAMSPEEGETGPKRLEEHIQFWMHNPNNLYEDIFVTAHKSCHGKVKASFPDFDNPTQQDWHNPMLPFILQNDQVVLRKLSLVGANLDGIPN